MSEQHILDIKNDIGEMKGFMQAMDGKAEVALKKIDKTDKRVGKIELERAHKAGVDAERRRHIAKRQLLVNGVFTLLGSGGFITAVFAIFK